MKSDQCAFRPLDERRVDIVFEPEDLTKLAARAEAAILAIAPEGSYVTFGGVASEIVDQQLPFTHMPDDAERPAPPVKQVIALDNVAMLARIEKAARFLTFGRQQQLKPRSVPREVVEILLKTRSRSAPTVTGLVSHPIVLHDGSILSTGGQDPRSGLFLSGSNASGARPFDVNEASLALSRMRGFLSEFEFASDLDADVAVAALMTGVQRRLLDAAPGIAILASGQSSGKTTLARFIHIVLTGQDLAVSTFAEGDEAETQKRLLAMLMRGPAMVCLDNITDGITFKSPSIAAAMTGPVLTQRQLGGSVEVQAPTNVLFAVTGNNLSLGRDELTRWLTCNLNARTVRPEQRQFRNVDVLAYVRKVRDDVLLDIVGLIAGYITNGSRIAAASRFPMWDRMVRQPLIWAGGSDMAKVFRANAADSEDVLAHANFLAVLYEAFGDKEFLARDVVKQQRATYEDWVDSRVGCQPSIAERLKSALVNLRAKHPDNELSVGRVLKGARERRAELTGDAATTCWLESRTAGGMQRWKVRTERHPPVV